jgi:hypothetical protein
MNGCKRFIKRYIGRKMQEALLPGRQTVVKTTFKSSEIRLCETAQERLKQSG